MAVSLVLSLILAYLLDIRFDEAFTLNTTSRGVVYAFHQAIKFEQQAPLYFVVLSLWRSVDSSIFFARLFSVLCFPLTVWVAAEVAKRYVKEVNPLIAAAIVALHQQVVWSALDIRLYSYDAAVGAAVSLFYDGYLSEKPNEAHVFSISWSRSSPCTPNITWDFNLAEHRLDRRQELAAAASVYSVDMLIVGLFSARWCLSSWAGSRPSAIALMIRPQYFIAQRRSINR